MILKFILYYTFIKPFLWPVTNVVIFSPISVQSYTAHDVTGIFIECWDNNSPLIE